MRDPNRESDYVMVGSITIPVDEVECLDISEGLFGEDRLTFSWEGKTYESPVYKR
jgi:hypothetical protein